MRLSIPDMLADAPGFIQFLPVVAYPSGAPGALNGLPVFVKVVSETSITLDVPDRYITAASPDAITLEF